MIIQHNIPALNSYNKLSTNNNSVQKNLQKLSSGYRINSAADDAAGLAISEKMRSQITGLERAKLNAQDGISLVQTAEGALTEVHSMLNRLVELGTESANGTIQSTDRQKIQDEVDALTEEIDRISQATNFNGIKLLDGSLSKGGASTSSSGTKVTTVEGTIGALKTGQQDQAATAGVYSVDLMGGAGTGAWASTNAIELTVKYTDADGRAQEKTLMLKTGADIAAGTVTDADLAAAFKTAVDADEDLKKLFSTALNTTGGSALEFTSTQAGTAGAKIDSVSFGRVITITSGAVSTDAAVKSSTVAASTKTAAADKTSKDIIQFTKADGSAITAAGTDLAGGDTITIGNKTYELVAANGDVTKVGKGNIAVNIGTDNEGTLKNLVSALQSNGVKSATLDASKTAIKIGNLEEVKAVEKKANLSKSSNGVKIANAAATKTESKFSVGAAATGMDGRDAFLELNYVDEEGKEQNIKVKYTADETEATNRTNIVSAINADEKLSKIFQASVSGTSVKLESITTGAGGAKVTKVSTTDPASPSVNNFQTTQIGRDKGQTISLEAAKLANGDTLTVNGKTFQFVDTAHMGDVAEGNIGVLIDATSDVNTAANLNLAFKQNGVDIEFNAGTNSFYIGEGAANSTGSGLLLQIGDTAEEFNKVTVSVEDMSSEGLKIDGLQVTDQGLSADSIDKINSAIERVSVNRGRLGALQNRMEHTINNLSTTAENLTSAESRIRDTDMAKEMMAFTKNNVLVQAAQSMLAQANQQPQQVLQLLR